MKITSGLLLYKYDKYKYDIFVNGDQMSNSNEQLKWWKDYETKWRVNELQYKHIIQCRM